MTTAKPALNIPPSNNTVNVSIIDSANLSATPSNAFYQPPITGIDYLDPVPALSFLLEHASGQKLLFDLGIAKDQSVLGSEVVKRIAQMGWQIDVERDVADILEEHGIRKEEVDAVIWRCVLLS